jgi:hypothetical protein
MSVVAALIIPVRSDKITQRFIVNELKIESRIVPFKPTFSGQWNSEKGALRNNQTLRNFPLEAELLRVHLKVP